MIEFLLRQGSEADGAAIAALLAANSMEADIPAEEFLVAEVESRLVGLARLEGEGEEVYIRPVVVDSGWQGKGLGRSLVQQVSNGLPAVHVIARGEVTGFYANLGFIPMAWEQVPARFRQECETCPDQENCRPRPMALDLTANRNSLTAS